jgi:hypothetical protein
VQNSNQPNELPLFQACLPLLSIGMLAQPHQQQFPSWEEFNESYIT